jgi:hypothetical protein
MDVIDSLLYMLKFVNWLAGLLIRVIGCEDGGSKHFRNVGELHQKTRYNNPEYSQGRLIKELNGKEFCLRRNTKIK